MASKAFRKSILTCAALLAALGASSPALAQDRARDMDAQTRELFDAQPTGVMRFTGVKGFLNYAAPIEPTPADQGPLQSVFSSLGGPEEPVEDLLPSQSRGMRIELNFNFLDGLREGVESRAIFPVFDGKQMELVFTRGDYRTAKDFTWFGQIAGVAASDFILTRVNETIFMTVRNYESKKQYEVQFAGQFGTPSAGHALRKIGDIRPPATCGTCSTAPGAGEPGNAPAVPPPVPAPGTGGYGPRAVSDPTSRIDVMVCCTGLARAAGFGNSESAFRAKAQACVDDMNLRLIGSGTGATVRLVHADWDVAADYSEDVGPAGGSNDLSNITNGTGALSDVAAVRTAVRADLVALIRFFTWSDPTACPSSSCVAGIAWRPSQLSTFQFSNNSSIYSVNSMTSGLPLVGDIFAHELGHNLGGCHDDAQGGCGGAGVTSSSKGIVIACDILLCINYWHTTMAYGPSGGCSSSTLLPFYSNPNINYDRGFGNCGVTAIGNATCNVANTINVTRPYVSQYRIAATRAFVYAPQGPLGNGTRFDPFGFVRSGVASVQGASTEADVRIFAGDYFETATNGGPVLLSNPALLVREQLTGPSDPPVVIR